MPAKNKSHLDSCRNGCLFKPFYQILFAHFYFIILRLSASNNKVIFPINSWHDNCTYTVILYYVY